MLDIKLAHDLLDTCLFLGADFADLFYENTQDTSLSFLNGQVHEPSGGIISGIGIRLIINQNVFYTHSSIVEKDHLENLLSQILTKSSHPTIAHPLHFADLKFSDVHTSLMGLENGLHFEEQKQILTKLDSEIRQFSTQIKQVSGNLSRKLQNIQIYNTDGLACADQRNYTQLSLTSFAEDGCRKEKSSERFGALAGLEFINRLDLDSIAKDVASASINMLKSRPCPGGKFPIILAGGFGGVIFHEACGHLLETTSVQKKASIFHDKLGHQIASEVLSAVDEGIEPNRWGSSNIDDEGSPTQKTQLIQNGILTSFLVDRLGHLKTGYPMTGSGRRQSYAFAPASRMRNTYIEVGKSSIDEMLSSVAEGIYAKKLSGGSVTPGTGEFNFGVTEAYLIKNGKIGDQVTGASLIGSAQQILNSISMVGNDLSLEIGMCGSVSGSIPAMVGQPTIKVDSILVGGSV